MTRPNNGMTSHDTARGSPLTRRHRSRLVQSVEALLVSTAIGAAYGILVSLVLDAIYWFELLLIWSAAGLCLGLPLVALLGPQRTIPRIMRVYIWAAIPIAILSWGLGPVFGVLGGCLLILYIGWRERAQPNEPSPTKKRGLELAGVKPDGPPSSMYCMYCNYSLTGLQGPLCPECGRHFVADDAHTWASHLQNCNPLLPIAGSFSGSILSWSVAYSSFALYQAYYSPRYSFNDQTFWLFWTSVVSFGWWMLVSVPTIWADRRCNILKSFIVALPMGALLGAIGLWMFLLLAGERPLAPGNINLTAWAATVGAGAALGAHLAIRPQWVRPAAGPPRRVLAFFWLLGPAVLVIWLFAIWPIVCRISPDLAYRVGGHSRQDWAIRYVLQQVEVGDPAIRLEQLLPSVFSQRALPASLRTADSSPELASGSWGFNCGHDYIRVVVEDGRIVELRY